MDPSDIPNLAFWWNLIGANHSEGDLVQTVTGKSGMIDLTQASASSRPVYRANAHNNQPGLEFDGVNDFMVSTASVLTGADECTLVMVFKPTGVGLSTVAQLGDSDYLYGVPYTWNGWRLARYGESGGNRLQWYGTTSSPSGVTLRESASGLNSGSIGIVVATIDRALSQADEVALFMSGVGPGIGPYGNSNLAGNFTAAPVYIGGQQTQPAGLPYFKGLFLEAFGYSRAITPSERDQLINHYLPFWTTPSGSGGGSGGSGSGGGSGSIGGSRQNPLTAIPVRVNRPGIVLRPSGQLSIALEAAGGGNMTTQNFLVGQVVVVYVTVTNEHGTPINATVVCEVQRDGGSAEAVTLTNMGRGVYRGEWPSAGKTAGNYELRITTSGALVHADRAQFALEAL